MTSFAGGSRPTLVVGRGASDAGGAASHAAAVLRRAWGLGASPAPAPGAPAGAEVSLARRLAEEPGARVVLLLAQSGRASHRSELPLRVDRLPGGADATVLLVTVPAYAAQAPQPAAALRLVEAAARVLATRVPDRALHEDAEAWRRGADELARRDERVARLVNEWERLPASGQPDGEEIAAGFSQLLGRG